MGSQFTALFQKHNESFTLVIQFQVVKSLCENVLRKISQQRDLRPKDRRAGSPLLGIIPQVVALLSRDRSAQSAIPSDTHVGFDSFVEIERRPKVKCLDEQRGLGLSMQNHVAKMHVVVGNQQIS